jgi:hypothetical protein
VIVPRALPAVEIAGRGTALPPSSPTTADPAFEQDSDM